MGLRLARSGGKHKIGKDRYYYVGVDDRGIELEIIIVPDDKDPDGWTITHAMPTSYRERP
ncbi:MAG: hypothetical protein ACRDMV_00765 [Streptosporangiales bacterium]